MIAIDLATTGAKAAIFENARMLASANCHYAYTSPRNGWAEQDAGAVWELVDGTAICTLKNPEAALLGAAILAQVAVGQFATVEEACRECVGIGALIEPRSGSVEPYAAAFDRDRQLNGSLRSFYHHWRNAAPRFSSKACVRCCGERRR